jgi:DNA polymerase I-like protein with 3'-5' exonuclease and polymerase domains/uracil-DNA glycosylase
MGFGFIGLDAPTPKGRGASRTQRSSNTTDIELLHRMECKACPLNTARHVETGHSEPAGSEKPLIYILGAAPTREADKHGKPYTGDARRFYRNAFPPDIVQRVRWGNVIRTYPGPGAIIATQNRDDARAIQETKIPSLIEIECCRPSVVSDIERTKPRAIFGLGLTPLKWAVPDLANPRAYLWQGRRFPVKIGKHVCWYYPFVTYNDVIRGRKWNGHVSDDERHFERCVMNACEELINDKTEPHVTTPEEAAEGVHIVNGSGGYSDFKRVRKFIDRAIDAKLNGFDYETNALRPYNATARMLTFAVAIKNEALAVALDHKGNKWSDELRERVRAELKRYVMADGPVKAAHQLSFEMEWSAVKFGRECVRGSKWGDTISQAYIIDPKQGLLGLEDLTQQYWGFNLKALSKVDRKNLDDEPIDDVLLYNGMDAKYHRALYIVQRDRLEQSGMTPVYEAQLRRVPTLVLTQIKGITLNQDVVARFRNRYQKRMRKAIEEMKEMQCWSKYTAKYGSDFNPGSPHDVVKMMTIIGHKTRSTTAEVLGAIDHKIIAPLLRWRKAQKLLGTYALNVSDVHTDYAGNPVERSPHVFDDGKIHPIISTYRVETWRTSSEDPNIQNWPKRGVNVDIRRSVEAPPGYKIVAFDYAGIQARNIAMESRDKEFVKTFQAGYDIHAVWTERIVDKYPKWAPKNLATDKSVFKESRGIVKNQFVFPTFFGAKGKSIGTGMAKGGHTTIPPDIITELQEELFEQFPRIEKWQKRVQENYERHGYVTGLSGHRRYAPIGFNQIINSPIQADEALIVTTAMSALSEMDYKRFQAMMEIHDDLTFLIPNKKVDAYSEIIVTEMARHRFDWINVPLVVEVSVGDNWCDLKDAGVFKMRDDGYGIESTHK